jgi:hypothetical protein
MESQAKNRAKIMQFGGLVMFLLLTRAALSVARSRPCVEVKIETEQHVGPPHTAEDRRMNLIFRPLKLTYRVPTTPEDQPITLSIAPGPVEAGAGLVVEHIAADGTRTTQSLAPEPWWFLKAETRQIKSSSVSTYFSVRVLPGMSFDFSKLGIYRISYVHPWAELQEDPNSSVYRSNILTIACVPQERSDQLHAMLRQNTELALASYRFKHPPSTSEVPSYQRRVVKVIDDAIKQGTKQDEVLLLLGSPDTVSYHSAGQQKTYGCDETWLFETSPVGGYSVSFKNGRVVGKTFYAQGADNPDPRNLTWSDRDVINE